MMAENEIYADWNPWHGCTKTSPGCKYCYVYRQDEMYGAAEASSVCRKTGNFDLPVKRKRGGSYKIPPGRIVFTCFTSDFLLKDADEWRGESGHDARPCDYGWVIELRRQCAEKNVPFRFHQTGAHFVKNGKMYNVRRPYQRSQARKAGIDYRIGENFIPETAVYNKAETYTEPSLFDDITTEEQDED